MEIEIAIDSYDDMFSDFDIRSFPQRQVSEDFLDELKVRMVRRTDELKPIIVLIIENSKRTVKHERLIIKRLKSFFEERYSSYIHQRAKNIRQSCISGILGLVFLFAAKILSKHVDSMFGDFLLIPSWYLVWSALENVLGNNQEITKKLKYYKELSESTIEFRDRIKV